jgi:hypothetical protein
MISPDDTRTRLHTGLERGIFWAADAFADRLYVSSSKNVSGQFLRPLSTPLSPFIAALIIGCGHKWCILFFDLGKQFILQFGSNHWVGRVKIF